MHDSQTTHQQNHPLYITDRDHIDRMLAKSVPEDEDLVDLARLLIRYEGFPGAIDLQEDMEKLLDLWGLSRVSLNAKTSDLWNKGLRPGQSSGGNIGSGFDASDRDEN